MAGHADFAGTACRVGGRDHLAAQHAKQAAGALGAPARQFCRAPLCESFPCTLPARPFSRASLYESYLRGIPPRSSEAHCKVATHCFLPSSPCSLLSTQNPLAALTARGFCVEKKVRAALLSRALERTIIAAGGLNGRVRDGNGCLTPASGTNQRDWLRPSQSGEWRCSRLQHSTDPGRVPPGRLSAALHAARPRPPQFGGGDRGRAASRPHGLSEAVW